MVKRVQNKTSSIRAKHLIMKRFTRNLLVKRKILLWRAVVNRGEHNMFLNEERLAPFNFKDFLKELHI